MNLIQVQERLKSLPSGPQTMQALMQYANGMNPAVPPYLALGELNRRKQLMEEAQQQQAGQPPQGTVKDQIAQTAGVMALQQGRQQQAMQQMMQGAGQMPGRVPPQVQAAGPVQMARGGIVALADGTKGSVEDEIRRQAGKQEAEASYTDSPDMARELLSAALRLANAPAQTPPSRRDVQAELEKADPNTYGILRTPIGQEMLKRQDELQAAQRAELAKQREEAARLRPGVLQQLGQAAMASRGQYGRSALASILGGYADIASKSEAEQVKQEQALRGKELEMLQARAELQTKVDDLRRAKAEGNVEAEAKARAELIAAANKRGLDVAGLLREAASTASTAEYQRGTLAGNAAQRAEQERHNRAMEIIQRMQAGKSTTPPEIQLVDRMMRDPKFREAYEQFVTTKRDPITRESLMKEWAKDPILRAQYKDPSDYVKLLMPSATTGGGPKLSPADQALIDKYK